MDMFAKERKSDALIVDQETTKKVTPGADEVPDTSDNVNVESKGHMTAEVSRQAFLAANFKNKETNPFHRGSVDYWSSPRTQLILRSTMLNSTKKSLVRKSAWKGRKRGGEKGKFTPPPGPPLGKSRKCKMIWWLFLPLSDTEDSLWWNLI